MKPRVRAFTLIELLVVIAIISILISILIPGLSAARRSGLRTACVANMRTTGLAAAMYAQDNADTFPLNSGDSQDGGWVRTLQPYAGGDRLIYRCPEDRSTDWFNPLDPPPLRLVNDRLNSYATNVYISPRIVPPLGAPDSTPRFGFIRRGLIPRPADTIHFGEFVETQGTQTGSDHIHADFWRPDPLTGTATAPPGSDVALGRHLGKTENYCFTDGHAESLRFSTTFQVAEDGAILQDAWDPEFRTSKPSPTDP